jgi:hypothetical protein
MGQPPVLEPEEPEPEELLVDPEVPDPLPPPLPLPDPPEPSVAPELDPGLG